MKKLFLFAAALVFLVTTSGPAKAQTTMTWTIDGSQRQAIVFAPAPTFFPIRHPLIFAFHGPRRQYERHRATDASRKLFGPKRSSSTRRVSTRPAQSIR